MLLPLRTRWIVLGIGALLLIAFLGANLLPPIRSANPLGMHVAVLFPSSDTDAWPDFVRGVRLAAQARGLTVTEEASRHACRVDTTPIPIQFQWHPVIGSFELQQKVRQLCRAENPPLAFVGSNNTSLTEAMGLEIKRSSRPDWVPLLLMTQATTDRLIEVNPGKSFRFGLSNSHQAKAVVSELAAQLAPEFSPNDPPTFRAIVLKVSDNPYSVDLAAQFERELREEANAEILPDPSSPDSSTAWTLHTAGRSTDGPSSQERELAHRIVSVLAKDRSAPTAIILPTEAETFAHLASALTQEKRRLELQSSSLASFGPIYLLTGDSLDYYDLRKLNPTEVPGPILLFSHVNPIDGTIANTPETHRPTVGLDRDVASFLFKAVAGHEGAPHPDKLAESMQKLMATQGSARSSTAPPTEGEARPLAPSFEREEGGGVVVAVPSPSGDRLEIRLPSAWAQVP